MNERANQPDPPALQLIRLMTGCWITQAIAAAAELGIADRLRAGPATSERLAIETTTDERSLSRLLRTLASLGIFEQVGEGWQLTSPAELLRSDHPASLRSFALMIASPESWQSWSELMYSVRTGRSAFEHVFGRPLFEYLAEHPDAARLFHEALAGRSAHEDLAIVAAYDFPPTATVVDIGGGRGTLLHAVLRSRPQANAVLFDMPNVVEAARAALSGPADRYRLEAGDFFERVPSDGDVYLLKKVLHDWDDERACAILRTCHQSMRENARLLLIEPVIAVGNEPSYNKLLDLFMLVWNGPGGERTLQEHESLLGAAGFRLTRVIATDCPLSILEAAPVG